MKDRAPAFQLYVDDYIVDTRAVSSAARGLWMDMICLMWKSPKRGYLVNADGKAMNGAQLTGFHGGKSSEEQVQSLVAELESAAIFSRTKDGIIYSRRMVEDEKIRKFRVISGQMGGLAKAKQMSSKPPSKIVAKARSSSSSSSSSSLTTSPVSSPSFPTPPPTPLTTEEQEISNFMAKTAPFWSIQDRDRLIQRLVAGFGAEEVLLALHQIVAYCADHPNWEEGRRNWPATIRTWLKKNAEQNGNVTRVNKILGGIKIKTVPKRGENVKT